MAASIDFFSALDDLYELLKASPDPRSAWLATRKRVSPWPDVVLEACTPEFDPDTVEMLRKRARPIGELMILDLATRTDDATALEDMGQVREVVKYLVRHGGAPAKEIAEGILVSMMIGIEALPEPLIQEVVECLCDIVDLNVGTKPRGRGYRRKKGEPLPEFFDILNGVLYSEVVSFHNHVRQQRLLEEHKALIDSISATIVSVGSRKGGTGKSLFVTALVTWLLETWKGTRVCILDLDLSGPVWQYLLFQESKEPSDFLDGILDLHQDLDKFDFAPDAAADDIVALVQVADWRCSSTPAKVGHLGVHDIPSINRTIDLAGELNPKGFYPFLAQVLEAVSSRFDFVVIDNSPGFHSVPYSSLGIACSVTRGHAFVVSTPSYADLRGTFLELSEFRLTNLARPPAWVINKSTDESEAFTRKKQTALEVAQQLQAYHGVLPECPVLEKILQPSRPYDIWSDIRFDPEVSEFGQIDRSGRAKLLDITKTAFYRQSAGLFEKTLRANAPPGPGR